MTTLQINIERKCLNGKDPEAVYEVRQPLFAGDFWFADEEITEWARLIIAEHLPEFPECSIVYLWKAKGGTPGGTATLGKCLKISGDKTLFSGGKDFEIWFAADHADAMQLTNYQMEALIYHELLHVAKQEDEDGKVKLGVKGHDFEGFVPEIERYGFWEGRVASMARAVQGRLDLADVVPPQIDLSPVAIAEPDEDEDGDEPPLLVEDEEPEIATAEQVVEALDGTVIDAGNGVTATIEAGPPKPMSHTFIDNGKGHCKTCNLSEGSELHSEAATVGVERKVPATEEEAQAQEEAMASLGARAK
jgi:hypothetical protein